MAGSAPVPVEGPLGPFMDGFVVYLAAQGHSDGSVKGHVLRESLLTPHPLGPVLDIPETCGGELEELVAAGARPYEVAAGIVRELRRRAPTVVVLEDVHWADGATLDVLRLLGRRQARRELWCWRASATTRSTVPCSCGSCSEISRARL